MSGKNRTTGSTGHVRKIWDWPQPAQVIEYGPWITHHNDQRFNSVTIKRITKAGNPDLWPTASLDTMIFRVKARHMVFCVIVMVIQSCYYGHGPWSFFGRYNRVLDCGSRVWQSAQIWTPQAAAHSIVIGIPWEDKWSRWVYGDHGGHGSGAQWSRLGEVTAQSRRGHSSGSHSSVTASSVWSQLSHG